MRDTVTIQIGATKVLKPGGEQNLSDKNADTLRALLSDPSQPTGTIKMSNDQGQSFLKVVGGETHFDHLNILPTVQAQTVEPITQTVEPITQTVEPIAQAVEASVQTPVETTTEQKLLDTIARLETRVGELEAKLNPIKLATPNVGSWMNGIRDGIAAKMRQTTDAISQRVHSVADRIAVTSDTVSQAISSTVSDVRENVTDGARLAIDVSNAAVSGVLDAGMQRHSDAVQGVNNAAAELVSGLKAAMDDPRQAYLDKVAIPTAAAMIQAAEKVPGRVQVDEAGNKSLNVGTHELRQSADGAVSLSRAGQNITAESLQTADVKLVSEMKQVVEPQAQKLEPQKIEPQKLKVSV